MDFSKIFVSEDTAYSTYERNVPAPLFRKSFQLNGEPDSAEILICGLGFYELYVNGRKITKGYLAPYISNSDHYTYFDRYDLKPWLTAGENVIGVMLGDGHQVGKTSVWSFKDNITNSAVMLALSVEITCGDCRIHFEADDFVCRKGPVLFNDLRSGVFYDARLEQKGWNAPGFTETGWHSPIVRQRPRGKAKLCGAPPVCVYREIRPVSITRGELEDYQPTGQIRKFLASITPFEAAPERTGGYIYDFGENNSGIFRLKIRGYAGQRVDLQCAEQLSDGKVNYNNLTFYPDGFCQRDLYILSGDGEEIFEPMFVYHGFRYIYVSGITQEQATEDLLTYLVMSSDLEERGSFECSDQTANAIWQMGHRSDRSNFFYFPTDCPHREKNGWTGDASVSAEHMIMTLGVEDSYREWLNMIRAAQLEDGTLPGMVPTDTFGYTWGNGPAWDSALFNLPYFMYKYRGDTQVITENAAAMLRYLEYISRKRDERGIVAIGLGDWVPVGKSAGDYDTDLGFTDSVMVLDVCRKAKEMFDAVGLSLSAAYAGALGEEMLAAVRREYVDPQTLVVRNRCQTSQAMAIYYDVLTDEEKRRGFQVLMDIIREDGYSVTSGFLGLRVLFHVLCDYGQAQLAWHMVTKKEYPSYGHWVEKGETTLLEHFFEYGEYYRESKNHHFLGDVVGWLMRCVGGLRICDSEHVEISPCFIDSLTWCHTTHRLPAGEVDVRWERTGKDSISLSVTCPENVSCIVDPQFVKDCRQTGDGKYVITL